MYGMHVGHLPMKAMKNLDKRGGRYKIQDSSAIDDGFDEIYEGCVTASHQSSRVGSQVTTK